MSVNRNILELCLAVPILGSSQKASEGKTELCVHCFEAASGWLLATLLPFAATPHVTYRQKPEKRLLVFHIIEQLLAAALGVFLFVMSVFLM